MGYDQQHCWCFYRSFILKDDIEYLLSIVESGDIKAIERIDNPIEQFIITFNLENGEENVDPRLLYNLFKLWCTTPITYSKFRDFIYKRFIRIQKNGTTHLKINLLSSKISKNINKIIVTRTKDKTKSKKYKLHFQAFMNVYELKKGNVYVEEDILYYLYDKWQYRRSKQNILNKTAFSRIAALHFDSKIINRMTWFAVEGTSIMKYLSKKEVDNWREGRKKYGKKIHKKIPDSKKEENEKNISIIYSKQKE